MHGEKLKARSNVRRAPGTGRHLVALVASSVLLSGLMVLTIAPPVRAQAMRAKLPSISINDVKVKEGDSGTKKLVFTVRLSRRSPATVHYRVSGGTAIKDDFKAVHGTLRFTRNIASRKITVKVIGDALHEPDETFSLHLTDAKRARIVDGVGRGTILDNDLLAGSGSAFSIGDYTVTEGALGTADAVFDVTVSSSSATPMTVDFATANGAASSTTDYNPAGGTLVFAPGETAKQVVVQVVGDIASEPNEKFFVNLSNATGATIADAVGVGLITDDDSGAPLNPSLTIANATVTEGNSGSTNAVFTVTLSITSLNTVTVNYTTAPGSAVAPADYTATSGVLTFNPGETSKQVIVQVQGDVVSEANETFSVNLSGATSATIADDSGLGTITDNDTPTITLGAAAVTEGTGVTVNAIFSLTLSAPSGGVVTVDFATADGSATAPADYVANAGGVVTFNPGEISKQIVVQVVGDIAIEPNETFSVNLSNPTNATIAGTGFGLCTITDNDTATVTIGAATVTEGNVGTVNAVFNVALSGPSGNTITVAYTTVNGSAVTPSDYIAISGTLTFLPGETVKQVIVQVVGDVVIEPNELFTVNLSNPTNATIGGTGVGVGTITNND